MSENITSRRTFLKSAVVGAAGLSGMSMFGGCQDGLFEGGSNKKPNILLVIADDQGFGDLACHGNPHLDTPVIDSFGRESIEFTNFYVSPVCAPTRASLMTGRYHMRTGVVDTYLGRAMMHSDEITLAETLKSAGYATALFGKWHLGDNYPLRPQDQGFDEVVMHMGGGLCQPSDYPGNSYFDSMLMHNGEWEKYTGYCMNVYTDCAMDFMKQNKDVPFFVYLATNTPHSPLEVPEEYLDQYSNLGLKDRTARLYGMVKNIDDNLSRLLNTLEDEGLANNTIVIYMSDNGPCPSSIESDRHMAGLRGQKGTVYENGIKVPFFVRLPGGQTAGRKVETVSAHIDIMPTLLDICGVKKPGNMDGVSLAPLIKGGKESLADRNLYFQWHRGDEPELYRVFAVRDSKYKLVQANGVSEGVEFDHKFELFDLANDPGEKNDIATQYPEIVKKMKKEYRQWFINVSAARGYAPPVIIIGSKFENPTTLTRQDWRGAKDWEDKYVGYWLTEVAIADEYSFTLSFPRAFNLLCEACLEINGKKYKRNLESGIDTIDFTKIRLPEGPAKISGWLIVDGRKTGVKYIDVSR
jgi:arylsulfatase A-like enzyme